MATVFTRRLFVATPPATAVTTLYVAPEGQTTILRDLVVANVATSSTLVDIFIDSPGVRWRLLYTIAFPASSSQRLETRQELLPGDQLRCQMGNPNISVAGTGYVF